MQNAMKSLGRMAVVVACLSGVACRDNNGAASRGEPAPRNVVPESNPRTSDNTPSAGTAAGPQVANNNTGPWNNGGATTPMGQPTNGTTSARGGGPVRMSDGDIAQITTVVNQGEIQQAQLVRTHGRNPEVQQFADHMIQQHQQMLQSQSQLLGRIGVSPVANDTSRRLESDGQSLVQTLQSVTGDDFDRQYIDAQVRQHQQVLQSLDSQLIPNAQNPQFRQALTDARTMVQQHLDEARRIQQTMGRAGATNPMAPAPMGGMHHGH